jgi:hypothetical protein
MNDTQKSTPTAREDGNQGEGNRTAAHRYNEAAERHAHSGASRPAAERAKAELDVDPAADAEAEAKGRAPATLSPAERVMATANRLRRKAIEMLGGELKSERRR